MADLKIQSQIDFLMEKVRDLDKQIEKLQDHIADTNKKVKLPHLLKQARREAKESQSTFGLRFGRSHAAVSDWESGKSDIPNKVIEWLLREHSDVRLSGTDINVGTKMSVQKLPEKISADEMNYIHNLKTAVWAAYEGIDHRDVQIHSNIVMLANKINAILEYLEETRRQG